MNNKLVLQDNNTRLENVLDIANKLPNKEDIYGQYIWKKYETDQTTFIGYVTSNNENAYPDNGTYKNYYYEKIEIDGVNFVAQYTGTAISTDGELLEIPNLPSSLNDQILTITLQLEELKPEMVPEYPGSGTVSYHYLVNGNVCVSDVINPYVYKNSALMVFYQSYYKRYYYSIEGMSNETNSKGIFQLNTINNKTYLKIKENIAYSSVYNYFVKNVNYKYFMTLNQRLQPVT